jgi:hypothetical protein
MWEAGKSVLLSKTVWTAIGGVVLAIANLLGWHIADAQISQAIDLILFVLTAVFRYTATQPVHIAPPKQGE